MRHWHKARAGNYKMWESLNWGLGVLLIGAFISLSLSPPLQAQTPSQSTQTVSLIDEQDQYPLGLHLEILEDREKAWGIDEVSSMAFNDQFRQSQSVQPNFGFVEGAIWLRFRVKDNRTRMTEWQLEVSNPNLSQVTIYRQHTSQSNYEETQTGAMLPFSSREIPHRHFVFNLPHTTNEQTVYLRLEDRAGITAPIMLWSSEALARKDYTTQLLLGLLYGVILIMLAYNTFLFIVLREASYFWYNTFITAYLLGQSTGDGLAHQYLWPQATEWNTIAGTLFGILAACGVLMFTRAFLSTKSRLPTLHISTTYLLVGLGILLICLPFFPRWLVLALFLILLLLTCLIALGTGFVALRKGYREARYFLTAWLTPLLGALFFTLVRFGILPSTPLTELSPRIGVVILVAFLSLALAERINLIKQERTAAQSELLRKNNEYTTALEYQHMLLRTVIDNIPDNIYLKDINLNYLISNIAHSRMLGVTPEEAVGKNLADFASSEEAIIYNALDRQVIQTGQVINQEYNFPDKNTGQERWSWLTRIPFYDAHDRVLGTVGISRDITQRKLDEAALEEYSERLVEMVSEQTEALHQAQMQLLEQEKLVLLGQLAGGVAHELRNPLAVINNSTYFLRLILDNRDALTDEYLDIIEGRIFEAEKIITALLSLARVQANSPGETDLAKLITEVVHEYPPPETVTLTNKISPEMSLVWVDRQQIKQVLVNLFINAYQAMPTGGELTISTETTSDQLHLSITDTGVGMSSDTLEKIFDPLFTTKAQGIGLGLAVSMNLAQVNNGTIAVESVEGQGSTFTITLPIAAEFETNSSTHPNQQA